MFLKSVLRYVITKPGNYEDVLHLEEGGGGETLTPKPGKFKLIKFTLLNYQK